MLEIGLQLTLTETVTEQNTAAALGSGGLDVYATPAMALLMENGAARAKQVVERYHAPYESKAAYFATLDAILRDRELIEYHEDTAQIRL